jgi:3-oxoacyl-[acyl-carrier protein] reductase
MKAPVMTDSYLNFANSMMGSRIASALGLPRPVVLERFQAHQPVIDGDVLVGASPGASWLPCLVDAFKTLQINSLAHGVPGWTTMCNQVGMMSGRWSVEGQVGARVKALVFDATGLQSLEQADSLYHFFHDTVRSLLPCGRVVLLGRVPAQCADALQFAVQRALEGFMRSLAKEVKRGIAVQLVQVDDDAHDALEGALRFFLSPRSAYVSGQVVRLQATSCVDATQADGAHWDAAQPLRGKSILVTGASRGIGEAIVETLARDGARVVCLDVPAAQDALQAVADRANGSALAVDISASHAPNALVQAALADGGRDGVVHNAGITRDKTLAKMPEHLWQSVLRVNLGAQASITQALMDASALRAGARMVCVSSIAGMAGNVGQTNYAFSKAGVMGLVHSLAPRLVQQGMAINAVAPGFIETQMTAAIPLAIREAGRRMNSMGQGGWPVDVAETIAWLLSRSAAGVNGQVIRVCGQSWLGA